MTAVCSTAAGSRMSGTSTSYSMVGMISESALPATGPTVMR
jgi:hypothetical protein